MRRIILSTGAWSSVKTGEFFMTFDDILAQIINLLQKDRRVSYRALKRRFELDEAKAWLGCAPQSFRSEQPRKFRRGSRHGR